jgi:hypothetical protein
MLLGAQIGADLDMLGANFAEAEDSGLCASRARIEGALRIEELQTNATTVVQLWQASCDVLFDDMSSWPRNHISLEGFTYRKLERPRDAKTRLDWIRRQLPADKTQRSGSFRAQPYRQLAGVLSNEGQEAAALDVLIGMEQDRRKYAQLGWWSWFWSFILWHVIRNGYKPMRAAGWLIALWLASGLMFGVAYDLGLVGPTDKDAFQRFVADARRVPDWYPPFSTAIYAIDVSLPIISLGQRDKWQPLAKSVDTKSESPTWLPGVVRVWRWIAIAVGWFLASMMVAGVTGLVVKK